MRMQSSVSALVRGWVLLLLLLVVLVGLVILPLRAVGDAAAATSAAATADTREHANVTNRTLPTHTLLASSAVLQHSNDRHQQQNTTAVVLLEEKDNDEKPGTKDHEKADADEDDADEKKPGNKEIKKEDDDDDEKKEGKQKPRKKKENDKQEDAASTLVARRRIESREDDGGDDEEPDTIIDEDAPITNTTNTTRGREGGQGKNATDIITDDETDDIRIPNTNVTANGTNTTEEDDEDEDEEDDGPSPDYYFYVNNTKAQHAGVIEYVREEVTGPVVRKNSTVDDDANYVFNGTLQGPDFLYRSHNRAGTPFPEIRIVEFYAHWCPHCQHFKNHYIQFAKQTKQILEQYLSPQLFTATQQRYGIYAVSCVPWKDVCQEFDLEGYPVIMLFEGNSTNGTVISQPKVHPFLLLEKLGIDLTEVDITMFEGKEEEEDTTSLSIHNPNEDDDEKKLEKQYFPKRTKKEIFQDAQLSFDFALRNAIFSGTNKANLILPGTTVVAVVNGTTVYTPPDTTKADAFKDWILLLRDALPPTWIVKALVGDLAANIDHICYGVPAPTNATNFTHAPGHTIGGEQKLFQILNQPKYQPKKQVWSPACTRGDSYAGYTCGLWELFHIMTLGVVEYNMYSSGVDDDWEKFDLHEASDTLRNYIAHFFACEVCRSNFLHAYDTCEHEVCTRFHKKIEYDNDDATIVQQRKHDTWIEYPFWLFEVHNGVNQRLQRERYDRDNKTPPTYHESLHVQWPSKADCAMCWYPDGRWDPDNIYTYLRLTYWPEDNLSAGMRSKLLKSKISKPQHEIDQMEQQEEDSTYGSTLNGRNRNRSLFHFRWYQLIVLIASGLFYSWYRKKQRLKCTGYHKKVDDDDGYCSTPTNNNSSRIRSRKNLHNNNSTNGYGHLLP